jgi:RHS repeat-associated protein
MVYDSYGVMSTDSGSVQADYVSYTGREAERDLGIYYYRARYYDPLTGRFMVSDPFGFSAGDVNLYRYVGNNPVNLNDPFGLKEYIFVSFSVSAGYRYFGGEFGQYYLIDPSTGHYHSWYYGSAGPGFSAGIWGGFTAAGQIEAGTYTGQDFPAEIHPISLTLSTFSAAPHGLGAQLTGTSFWGGGDLGWTAGYAYGIGASISGFGTYSFGHRSGDLDDLPEWIRRLIGFRITDYCHKDE